MLPSTPPQKTKRQAARAVRPLGAATGVLLFALAQPSGWARELGVGDQYPPGLTLGIPTGANLPPGIWMLNRASYYSSNVVDANGNDAGISVTAPSASVQLSFVPGWTFLGASYMAFIVQPAAQVTTRVGGVSNRIDGFPDTALSPVNLSWDLGNSWFVSAGFTFYGPDGSISGPLSTSGIGANFWTFEPSVAVSYLGGGYDLTAHLIYETNTANPTTKYRSGDQLFLDLTATKSFGKWEIGPVGYYTMQTTSDSDPNGVYAGLAAAGVPGIYSRPTAFALGGLVGYDLDPARLQVYATDEVFARYRTQGWKVWARMSFKLCCEEMPRNKKPAPAKR